MLWTPYTVLLGLLKQPMLDYVLAMIEVFLRWAHIRANTTGAVIGLTKEEKLQCTLSERSWLVLATSHSLSRGLWSTRKQVCGIGLCFWWCIAADWRRLSKC
ncbi:uncharacterized protein K441DRAFT_59746 [Cenococcum geophilum 1.58]|uniref:uncharacterized protein n=1 Tax=Cenococcum geophilum 1.58 TaxID=794803 RepID=UPI00358DF82F|nr:hypothetical protein K441DRAFT_59746 [Cenococcum geophilum 1.58]